MKRSTEPVFLAFVFLLVLLNGCAPGAAATPVPPAFTASSVPPTLAPPPVQPASTPSPIPPTLAPTSTKGPSFGLECTPIKVKLEESRPPNVYAATGQFVGTGTPDIGALRIDITGETGEITSQGNVTSEISADYFHINMKIDEEWTFSDSKNVYHVVGKIVYDLPDFEKLSGYDIRVSGGGFGTLSKSCKKS